MKSEYLVVPVDIVMAAHYGNKERIMLRKIATPTRLRYSMAILLCLAWHLKIANGGSPITSAIVPDTAPVLTMGTRVDSGGNEIDIRGGNRPNGGGNLFHSFAQFSLGTGDTANFHAPSGVDNIISRVTGGLISEIDGTLSTEASLFFLNPAGVMFGPHAELDVQGSFHVGTADFVQLGDEGYFHASRPEQTVLAVTPPSAFGFLGAPSGDIRVDQSALELPTAFETLSMVGGDITILGGRLAVAGGQVHVVSVASQGQVPLSTKRLLELGLTDVDRFGEIELDATELVVNDEFDGMGSGTIVLRAGRLTIKQTTVDARGRFAPQDSLEVGIDIKVSDALTLVGSELTTEVSVRGSVDIGDASEIGIEVGGGLTLNERSEINAGNVTGGDGGDIRVRVAGDMVVADTSMIDVSATEEGGAGRIDLNVDGELTATGDSAITATANDAASGAGTIEINASHLRLDNALIATRTLGQAGETEGKIVVKVDDLTLTGGGIISTTTNDIRGGVVDITADNIHISAQLADSSRKQTGIFSAAANGDADQRGGDIRIDVGALTIRDGAQISTSTAGAGMGGTIGIQAETILLDGEDSRIVSRATEGTGMGGMIDLRARDIQLRDGALISSETLGRGDAGQIAIRQTETLTLQGRGAISTATSNAGAGGTAMIDVQRIELQGDGSGIFSNTVQGSAGNGGSIAIQALDIQVLEGASISSESLGVGDAGQVAIRLNEALILQDGGKISTATSSSGAGGIVTIDAQNIALQGVGSGIFSNAAPNSLGNGGSIAIQTIGMQVLDGASISSESLGMGDAGQVAITVDDTLLIRDSAVTTFASGAGGGNIDVDVRFIMLVDSQLTAEAQGVLPDDAGGNVMVQNSEFVILNDSAIQSNAFAGNGGDLTLVASEASLRTPESILDASSVLRNPGEIDVRTPISELSGVVAPLPETFNPAAELLDKRCIQQFEKVGSSRFLVSSRDRIPVQPNGVLPSPTAAVGDLTASPFIRDRHAVNPHGKQRMRSNGMYRLACARRYMP